MLQVQLHSWYMENLLSHVFAQVKWTYNPKYTREVFRSEDDIKVLNIVGGIRMEFTCDDAAINVFSIHTRGDTKAKKSASTQRPLVVAFPDGTTLRGHYTYHADKMHTHFRFSPTTDGMLHLLKLIDFSMAQVMKLVGNPGPFAAD
jgi:hypothetical protein